MAQPDLARIVLDAWDYVRNEEPTLVWLVTKDGRWFATWVRHLGRSVEALAHYQAPRYSWGIVRKGTFDLQPECHLDRPVYRQRKGSGQPRFDFVSNQWVPMEKATAERMESLRPSKDIFASKSLLHLLR